MGRKNRRSRFVPVPGTAPVTRSRSRAVVPGFSREPGTGIAPTITEEAEIEPSGSQSTTSGRQRHSSAPSRPAVRMPTNPAQKLPPSASTEAVPDSIAAYVPNSPIRKPHLVEYDSSGEELCGPYLNPDPELYKAYKKAKQDYSAKIAKLMELPTLDEHISIDPEAIQETAGDTILKAAKFVLGLSSYIDGVLLRKCSGILIEWNKGNGTILTTARLICSRSPNVDEWLGGREYALKAEVHVQLLHMDDTDAKGKLVYLDKQYDFALISVPMDLPTKLACFSDEVKFGQDVILLGRDKWHLKIANGKVRRNSAGFCDHHHLMYTDADIPACGAGGAVIDFKGDVIGMLNSTTSFIPSSTILKCLHLWRTFNCVPRIHLGMKFFGIEGLNLASKETISRKYNVDAGLIVLEVSGGSTVEKLGVRMGDIVQAVNGKHISATVELENMLLDICKVHLEDGVGRYSNVDVMVVLDVFNTTKRLPGRIQLRAKLSHDLEIITRGKYRISARDICTSI